ncbi:hypothetical protein EYF80_022964 [Liparis tanakae]|uniref:Uncharacterized protein n=1 Tax=Liparis tanakae TaxID=230148 RepID=A0A4Z2HNR1_9TELE|nr:hypothetical protein EYF80_022964 [Liparis tanakae]
MEDVVVSRDGRQIRIETQGSPVSHCHFCRLCLRLSSTPLWDGSDARFLVSSGLLNQWVGSPSRVRFSRSWKVGDTYRSWSMGKGMR